MKYNYPVKYVVMPIIQEPCYGNDYERTILCYIVSKCYVVRTVLDYLDNGNIALKHEVVFPFKDITYFKMKTPYAGLGYRNIPLYDLSGEPYPVNTTYNLYDTFEEAKQEAKFRNEERLVEVDDEFFASYTY